MLLFRVLGDFYKIITFRTCCIQWRILNLPGLCSAGRIQIARLPDVLQSLPLGCGLRSVQRPVRPPRGPQSRWAKILQVKSEYRRESTRRGGGRTIEADHQEKC